MLTENQDKNLKAFLFAHTALKPICNGVQNAHSLAEMFVKYSDEPSSKRDMLRDWARNHKTIVMRDGGDSHNLARINYILEQISPIANIPYASFCESDSYMEGILTSVGFIMDKNVATTTIFVGYTTESLIEVIDYEKSGDGLSKSEAYGILNAVIDSTRSA